MDRPREAHLVPLQDEGTGEVNRTACPGVVRRGGGAACERREAGLRTGYGRRTRSPHKMRGAGEVNRAVYPHGVR